MLDHLKNHKAIVILVSLISLAFLVGVFWFWGTNPIPDPDPERRTQEYTGDILIDVSDTASQHDLERIHRELHESLGTSDEFSDLEDCAEHSDNLVELSDSANLFRLSGSNLRDVVGNLRNDSAIESVEREGVVSIPSGSFVRVEVSSNLDDNEESRPNDPMYRFQWHMDQIQMPEAWSMAGGQGVVVAVIDTGVAYGGRYPQAPDLNETTFVPGWDFVDNDAQPDDEHGHGTHCAGTVAQSTNNGIGVTGVAPRASIMPVRVLDAGGSGSWGGVAAGIRWAADNGANIISMSLGGPTSSSAIQSAINHAHANGVMVIAAAGNSDNPWVDYPGGNDNVMAVGATNYSSTRAWYSSYGEGLDIVAPGGDTRRDENGDGVVDGVIQNTLVDGNPYAFDYFAWQGTSMATPHAAGVAALVYSAGVHDPDQIQRIMEETASDLGDTEQYAAGLIQAHDAVEMAQSQANNGNGPESFEETAITATSILGMLSVFPMLMLIGLTLHIKKWRRVLSSVGVLMAGMSALGVYLLTQLHLDTIWIVLGSTWLILNGIMNLGLSKMVSRVREEEENREGL